MPRIILPWAAQTAATRLAGIVRQPKLRQPALLRDIGIANQYARGMSVALVGAAMRSLRPFDAVSCSMGSTTPSAEVQNGMSGWRLTGTDNNSYVELQGPALSAGSRYETVCATFVVNSNSTGNYGAIASKCDLSQSLNGWCLFVENGGWIRIYAKDGGSQVVNTASSRTFNDGKVHTVVATFGKVSGDQVLVYVDGVLEISTTIGGSWGYNSPVFRLGNVADSYWGEFIGTIFQFTAWNRALSDVEAYALSRQPWTMFLSDTPFSLPLQSAQNDFTALLSEGASLADAIGAVLGISASATEAATLADTLDGALAFTAAATESVTLADSESGVYGISSSITESMTLSDAASLIYGLAAEVSEALAADAAQDGSVPTGDFSASLSDAAALADSASSGLGVYAAISAALSLADALSGAMAAGADAGDALTLDEAATRVLGLFSQASEASALDDLSDSVRGVTGGVTEALTATSGQAAVLSSFAGIDESMTLSELEASAKGYAVAIVGALALLEALRARLDRAFAASGARGGRAALDTGSRGGRATSARLGRTDSSRRTRH